MAIIIGGPLYNVFGQRLMMRRHPISEKPLLTAACGCVQRPLPVPPQNAPSLTFHAPFRQHTAHSPLSVNNTLHSFFSCR